MPYPRTHFMLSSYVPGVVGRELADNAVAKSVAPGLRWPPQRLSHIHYAVRALLAGAHRWYNHVGQ